MKVKISLAFLFVVAPLFIAAQLPAQDLGPQFKKIKEWSVTTTCCWIG
jgi:hypothetical protein